MTIEEIQKRAKEVSKEIGKPCCVQMGIHETFVRWYLVIGVGTDDMRCGAGDTLEEAISDAKADLAAATAAEKAVLHG